MFLYPIQSLENIIIGTPVFKVIYIFSALIILHLIHVNVSIVFFHQLVSFILLFLLPSSHISAKYTGKIFVLVLVII